MADVKKCDRCGKVYYDDLPHTVPFLGCFVKRKVRISSRKDGIMHLHRFAGSDYTFDNWEFDLCDDCMEELESWMRGENEDKR